MASSSTLTCTSCGNRIKGGYYTFGTDEPFCKSCVHHRHRCGSCGKPVGNQHWQLHDGRFHCATCHSTAIYDTNLAHKLYQETIAGLIEQPGIVLHQEVFLRIIDAPNLIFLRQQSVVVPGQPNDPHLRTLGLYHRKGGIRTIYLLYGLPRIIFRSTLAHEYAHAWQGENCPNLTEFALIEGFAEWVAFYHLLWLDATKAARQMLETPHPYREALDYLFQLEQRLGTEGVLDYMRRA